MTAPKPAAKAAPTVESLQVTVDALTAQVAALAGRANSRDGTDSVTERRLARLEQISGWVPDDIAVADAQDVAEETKAQGHAKT